MDQVELELEVRKDDPTKLAIAFFAGDFDHHKREKWVWLPRTQVEIVEQNGDTWTVKIPQWLAEKKDLV